MFLKHTNPWRMTITTIKFKVTIKSYELILQSIIIILNPWTDEMYVRIPACLELSNMTINTHPKTYRYIFKLRNNREEYEKKKVCCLKK